MVDEAGAVVVVLVLEKIQAVAETDSSHRVLQILDVGPSIFIGTTVPVQRVKGGALLSGYLVYTVKHLYLCSTQWLVGFN